MTTYTMRIDRDLIQKVKVKAGSVPIALIIRRLLVKWLKGEVKIEL